MKITPVNCFARAKSTISSMLPERFSFGRIKTQLCDTFERITHTGNKFNIKAGIIGESQVSAHDTLSKPNIHLRDFIENPNSRFRRCSESVQKLEKLMEETDSEFVKLAPLKEEMTVYRGRSLHPSSKRLNRDFGIVASAKEGDIITPDLSYAYAEYTRPLAEVERVSNIKPEDIGSRKIGGIMYEIVLPKGAQVSRGENVLMPREAKYQILQKSQEQDGCTFVKLKYMLP